MSQLQNIKFIIGEEFIEETNRTILEEIIEDFNEQIEVRIRDFRDSIGME